MRRIITCNECEYYEAIDGICCKDGRAHYPQHTCVNAKECNLAKKMYAEEKRKSCPFI